MGHANPSFGHDRMLEQPVRIRIAWGGNEPRRWSGRIALDRGSFSNLQLLGMDADAAGSVWIDEGLIRIDSIQPHRFDGVDVTVTGGDAGRLAVQVTSDAKTGPVSFEIPLSEVVRRPFRRSLDWSGSELLVHRSPGDALRIETQRTSMIFAPGEEFSFVVRPVLDELSPSTTIDVTTALSHARGGGAIWSDEQRFPVPVDGNPAATMKVPLPSEEGVFNVRVSVSLPPGVRAAFFPIGGSKPLAERTFQIVTLQPTPRPPGGEESWEQVLEIDPANPRWWQRLPTWTQLQRLPGFVPRPLGSVRTRTIDRPLGRFVELPPTAAGDEPHWQAYALPIEKTGQPHLLEVAYPADEEQHIGLSILEPNAAGRIVPVGRDSGVYVEGLGRSEQTQPRGHRVIFWPRTNSPLLLVTNLHPSAGAQFGRIRVLRAGESLAAPGQRTPWRESQRLVAAYLARPLVPEQFGASEGLDASSGESADDWQTFMEGSERLVEYLRFAGYNTAVVNVLADGSTIYPTQRVLPTPLYDTGRTATGAIDLPGTDALELLLRVFDREGLALVPSLQLSAPIPALESLRRQGDPQTSGVEWIGGDGRTWLETNHTQRGLAPYYNLLDSRVQSAVLGVATEIVERYGHHEALAGLAVQLSANGYGQLPGLEWGFDDATIAMFERETGIRLGEQGPNRFAARQAALLGPHVNSWRQWRAGRVTQFYRELAQRLQGAGADRRLLLTWEDMFSAPRLKSQLHPNVLSKSRVEQLMLDVGIDRLQLQQIAGTEFCALRFVGPNSPLVDRAIDLELNELATAGAKPADSQEAALLYHRPHRVRLSSFDTRSGLDSYTLLVAQSSPDATAVRKPLARVLAESDPAMLVSGGELLPMGQEEATRDILRALQQLPTGGGASVHRQQPLTVRTYSEPNRTTCLLVNECPWSTDAAIALDLPADVDLELMCGTDQTTPEGETAVQRLSRGQQVWTLQMKPYGIAIARLSSGGVRVAAVRATVSEAAKAELQARLADLTDRDLTAKSRYEKLANAGLEPVGENPQLVNWKLSGEPAPAMATAELDTSRPAEGKSALHLQSRGHSAAVESDEFATPPTGQLAMEVWIRGENIGPQSELRMVFEAEREGQPYRTYAVLGGNRPGGQPLRAEWKEFVFGVKDVPLDSQGKMRIRFELVGSGDVWIDGIELYDVLFPLASYQYTEEERLEFVKLIHAASSAYSGGRLADCVRLLDGYWPRFLMAYTPLVKPAPAVANQIEPIAPVDPANSGEAAPGEEEAPSLGERLRRWIPWR
jgi:hypothetical protein